MTGVRLAIGLTSARHRRNIERARAVSLTDEGLRLHSRADAAAREHERRVFSKLTEAERTQLRTMMLKLRPLPKMFLPPESSDTG